MKLTLADFPVRQIRLGNTYGYQDGLLEVDCEDLVRLVSQDGRIGSARIDVVSPGDPVRITGIGFMNWRETGRGSFRFQLTINGEYASDSRMATPMMSK